MKRALVLALLLAAGTSASAATRSGRSADDLIVPPYLEVLVFEIRRTSRDTRVQLHPPGHTTPLRAGVNGVGLVRYGDLLETIVVPRPVAGKWSIRTERGDAQVRVLSQQFFPRGFLLQPSPREAVRQHDRFAITYRILDGEGAPVEELRHYPLAVELSLLQPDGITTRIPMDPAPTLGKGAFRSRKPVDCSVSGKYWIDVRLTTVDGAGRPIEIFRDRWSGFVADPAKRVDCRVNASGTMTWVPLTMEIECVDAERRLVDMNEVANDRSGNLFKVVVERDGRAIHSTLDLDHRGRGAFRGTLRGLGRAGVYTIAIDADPLHIRHPYNVRVVPQHLSARRRTPVEWIAVPLLTLAILLAVFVRRRR